MNEPWKPEAKALLVFWIAGLALVILKAARIIDWPWLWVTAPIWMPVAGFFALLVIAAATMALARFLAWIARNL